MHANLSDIECPWPRSYKMQVYKNVTCVGVIPANVPLRLTDVVVMTVFWEPMGVVAADPPDAILTGCMAG